MLGLLLAGAAPATAPLPVPPIPPRVPPRDDAAPVPDGNAHGPAEAARGSFRVEPRLYWHEKTLIQGEGYTPGSTFRETERERTIRPTPGFKLRVTLP